MEVKTINKIQFLTMTGCHSCAAAKKIFDEILPDFSDVKVDEIDIATPKGQKLVQEYGIMASPGIVINDELFSTGGTNKEKLVKKLKSLAN